MGSSDNVLVNDGLGDDNNQELIIIPITKRTPSPSTQEGYSTENGVTVINFDKSKHVACDQCSLSLRSMKCLENHMKAKHNANDSSFYCSECGVSMATRKQLKKHQRCHKTISEKLTSGTVRRVSSVAAGSVGLKMKVI